MQYKARPKAVTELASSQVIIRELISVWPSSTYPSESANMGGMLSPKILILLFKHLHSEIYKTASVLYKTKTHIHRSPKKVCYIKTIRNQIWTLTERICIKYGPFSLNLCSLKINLFIYIVLLCCFVGIKFINYHILSGRFVMNRTTHFHNYLYFHLDNICA